MTMQTTAQPIELLLVEDNPADVRLVQEALKDAKVLNRLSVAKDGVEALAFLRRQGEYKDAPRPDLILLDLQLPKKTGREVLADVRSDAEMKAIPVVVLTGSLLHRSMLEEEGLAVESYLSKPVDLPQFYTIIRSLRKYMLSDVILPQ
jgi:chemotaxis family two-component system response regulator Rcp1